jgi:hypothetical protein
LDSPQGLVGLLLLAGDYDKLRLRITQIVNALIFSPTSWRPTPPAVS